MDLLTKIIQSKDDIMNRENMGYSGTFSHEIFYWKDAFRMPTHYTHACSPDPDNQTRAQISLITMRTILLITPSVMVGLSVDQFMRADNHNPHFVGFGVYPHTIIYLLILIYHVTAWALSMLAISQWDDYFPQTSTVSFPIRLGWFCYDMALPGSVLNLILYVTLRKDAFSLSDVEDPGAWNLAAAFTLGSVISNMLFMLIDMFLGRMVLFPGHVFHFLFFSAIYSAWFLYMSNQNPPFIPIIFILSLGLAGVIYMTLSGITVYLRMKRSDPVVFSSQF